MIRKSLGVLCLTAVARICAGEEESAVPSTPPAGPAAALGPAVAAPITRIDPPQDDAKDAGRAADAVRFGTDAKWAVAGYNNEEIVFTIFIRNEDARIIRCTTRIKGYYFENGTKSVIEDRQLTTIFPEQQAQVGNWLGMDEKSGATYSVKCRAV